MHTGKLVTRKLQANFNCEHRTRNGCLVNPSSQPVRSRLAYGRDVERRLYRLALRRRSESEGEINLA